MLLQGIEVAMVLRTDVVVVVETIHVIETTTVAQATQIAIRTIKLVGKQSLSPHHTYLFHTALVAVSYQPVFEQEANSSNVLSTI